MTMLARLFRHLTTTGRHGRKAFPEPCLETIHAAIAAGEKMHRAEVRLVIEPALPLADVLRSRPPRARARELFVHERIWDTEENCGVLVYVNLADHKVEIVADRASGRAIPPADWQAVCATMTRGFAAGQYEQSVLTALAQLNGLLGQHFPASGNADSNELPDRPLLL